MPSRTSTAIRGGMPFVLLALIALVVVTVSWSNFAAPPPHAVAVPPPGTELIPSVASASPRVDRFAAVQMNPEPGALEANRRKLTEAIIAAARDGARYIVLPELALVGPLVDADGQPRDPHAEPIPGPTTDHFGALARRLGVWLAVSMVEEHDAGYSITSVLLDDAGAIASRVRKRVLRPNGEDGDAVVGFARILMDSVDDAGRRIAAVSGDDLQNAVPRLADRGADTILVNANWSPDDRVRWASIVPRLVRQFRVNLVVANRLPGMGGVFPRGREPIANTSAKTDDDGISTLIASLTTESGWHVPASRGLPSVPIPSHRPFTPEVVELGRALFFDEGMSSNGTVSCATCHQPEQLYADGKDLGEGIFGRRTQRNVPSLMNVAYRNTLQWDGNPTTIEQQFKYPLAGFAELNQRSYEDLLQYLRSQPRYMAAFQKEFGVGPDELRREHVAEALGMFMRTLVSGNSPFDRYFFAGEEDALSPAARRGLELFRGKARCTDCHLMNERYALFMDSKFHRLGIGWVEDKQAFVDPGVGVVASNDYVGMFFTPSLRNVAETGPYMHDGSVETLREAITIHYARPEMDPTLTPVDLDDRELDDLVAFLESLSGEERCGGPRGECWRRAKDGSESKDATAENSRGRARRLIGRD